MATTKTEQAAADSQPVTVTRAEPELSPGMMAYEWAALVGNVSSAEQEIAVIDAKARTDKRILPEDLYRIRTLLEHLAQRTQSLIKAGFIKALGG